MGPLLSFVALFALPLLGAILLDVDQFAFWSLLASVSTIALSLDFGGVALLTAQYHFATRRSSIGQSAALSTVGSVLVGAFAAFGWLILASSTFEDAVDPIEGVYAIAAMTVAAAVRSCLLVLAQASLLEGWLAIRNIATAGQAALAVAVTTVWLIISPSFWALPLGWLISGLLVLPICGLGFAARARKSEHAITASQDFSWLRFSGMRTVNTLVASVVLQGDRWILALLGGPVLLAAYEVCWRFATLPRILVQNLSVHISVDAAPTVRGQGDALIARILRSTKVTAAVGFASVPLVGVTYWAFASWFDLGFSPWLFLSMALVFTTVAATSPMSIAGAAVGRAAIDLPYASFALAGMLISALIAVWMDSAWAFVIGYLLSLALSVPLFFGYAPAMLRAGLERRQHLP